MLQVVFQRRIFTALSWLKNIRKDQDEEKKQKNPENRGRKWAYLILAALIVFAMPLADKTLQHYIEVVIERTENGQHRISDTESEAETESESITGSVTELSQGR